ncbi:MAG: VWA domain-containing protein [Gammaproteobacteria bacterium]|nr:VWA domain-containing protein [Gammaproteobacteria bacterium]
MMGDLHFLRPEWLLAIPAWLALVFLARRAARGDADLERICDPGLVPYVVDGGRSGRSGAGYPALALAGIVAVLALAGPAWRELPQPVFRGQAALVIALDVSRSMNAADLEPSRLVRARLEVRDILDRRVDGRTALVAYAGDAFTVTPLTDDTRTIAALLPSLDPEIMPAPGSRADRALDHGRALLRRAGALRGRLLLVTDSAGGTDLEGAVARLTDAGYTLSILGMGTPDGAPIPDGEGFVKDAAGDVVLSVLDEPALHALAERGGGAYSRYRLDDADIAAVMPADGAGEEGVPAALETDRWREEGPWLLLVLLVGALRLFRRGRLD